MDARWLLAALALAAAGCLDAGTPPAGLPLDADGDALPTLYGVVVDGAIRPLAGVQVRFLGTDVNATTDADGLYEIRRPTLRAEDVLVAAFKDGFVPLTHQVQVSGHRSTKMDFILAPDPYVGPHLEVLAHSGLVRCVAVAGAPGQLQGLDCASDRWDGGEGAPPNWMWDITPTPGFAGLVVQVDWEPATPMAQNLRVWLKGPMAGGRGGEVLAEATGASPLRLEIPLGGARSFDRWTTARLHVEYADAMGLPVGAGGGFEQPYDAYASVFYVDPAPAGYTLG